MRKYSYMFLIVTPIVFVSSAAYSEVTNSTIAFYVVSEKKIESGRFIDTPDIPKLGYIAVKPDLAVTNLQEVFPEKHANTVIIPDKDGNSIAPSDLPQYLVVRLRSDDAKQFIALTEKSVGKQLLVMLDDKPLTAWKGEA